MNIIICAIARNENQYINEWVKHHLDIGFSHIYIYDNNSTSDPYIGDCIDKDLLDRVTIFDWRDIHKPGLQLKAYNEFYKQNTFDWGLFCDIDEFITGTTDINETLSNPALEGKEQIKVKIELFGDDGVIERDESIPVMEFFKKPITNQFHPMVKCFVRGNLPECIFSCVHYAQKNLAYPLDTCFASGKQCDYLGSMDMHVEPPDDYTGETLFLNHYQTKTLKEFLQQKYMLVWVLMPWKTRGLEYYWIYNEKTPEKVAYAKQYCNEHNIGYLDRSDK